MKHISYIRLAALVNSLLKELNDFLTDDKFTSASSAVRAKPFSTFGIPRFAKVRTLDYSHSLNHTDEAHLIDSFF